MSRTDRRTKPPRNVQQDNRKGYNAGFVAQQRHAETGVRPPTADAPNTTRSVTLTLSDCCWSAIMLLALKRERETNGKSAEHNERIPATSNGVAGKKTLLGGWVTDKPSTAWATVGRTPSTGNGGGERPRQK